MTRLHRLYALLSIAPLQIGCLTTRVAVHATNPHPSFFYLSTVSAAAVRDGVLFLRLEALQGKVGAERRASVVGVVDLQELKVMEPEADDGKSCHVDALRRMPIHVLPAGIMPSDATPVPVREMSLNDRAELAHVVNASNEPYLLLLIHGKPGGPLHNLYTRCRLKRADPGGPFVAVVFPSPGTQTMVSLMQDFEERPRTRLAWWLLSPLSAVGDIVTSPLQLIYFLAD